MKIKAENIVVKAARNGYIITSMGSEHVAKDASEAAALCMGCFIDVFEQLYETQRINVEIAIYGNQD